MTSMTIDEKRLRRKRWAWYMYDFGNSAYAAVVLLAVYSAYFKGTVVGGAEGSRLWGIAVGFAMLVVVVISPILGAIADFSRAKKKFLLVFTAIAVVFTTLLFFVEQGDVVTGMVFFILAEIGYRAAQVYYNSLLPEIADQDEMGRISGIGWAVGSAGGVICLLIILPLIMIFEGTLMVRLSLVITAAYFALATLPLLFGIQEKAEPQTLPEGETYLSVGFRQIRKTIKAAREHGDFLKFVLASLIYNGGVMMAMNFASIIGAVLFGMDQTQLIIFVIVVQVTNVAGAYVLGHLVDRWSGKRALAASIALMIAAIIAMFLAKSMLFFFFIGAVAGFAMAGMQSISRTMVGILAPEDQSAEFYGFFAVAGRTSSFFGPAVYGGVAFRVAQWMSKLAEQTAQTAQSDLPFLYRTAYQFAMWIQDATGIDSLVAEQVGQRVAILSIGVFLLIGLLLLNAVNETEVRKRRRRKARKQ